MRLPAAWIASIGLCSLVASAPARAEPKAATGRSVAAAPVIFKGRLAAPARERIVQGVRDGIERAGARAVETEATHVLRTRVVVEDRSYHIRVGLFDGRNGREIANDEVDCEICGSGEAAELTTDSTARLLGRLHKAETAPTFLIVRTRPAGATVTVDGRQRGVAPLELGVVPGQHRIRAHAKGHDAAERVVETTRGTREVVALELPRSRRRSFVIAGASTLGAGVAAVVSGAVLIGIHGRPHQPSCGGGTRDINGACPQQYRSLAAGTVLTSVGVAAVVVGAVLLTRHRRNRRSGRRAARQRASVRSAL